MGRYVGPSCRQCRREGTKLFLKGTKCFTEKCPVERRPYAPGQHGQNTARRRKSSEYSKQLREKQKIKRIYGVSEAQFHNTFERVTTLPGITGHNLLAALESRLDNMVYRLGFAASRKAARQLIRHRHVEVNQRAVDIPSYQVQPGEEIRVRQKSREMVAVQASMDQASRGAPLSWLAALESRLDNMVYRLGFAASRKAARQLIRHRHVEVNQRAVDIPSYQVQPGEEIRVRQKSREMVAVQASMDQASRGAPLSWLAVDRESFSGRMLERPTRPNIPIAAQEQLVVELYSK